MCINVFTSTSINQQFLRVFFIVHYAIRQETSYTPFDMNVTICALYFIQLVPDKLFLELTLLKWRLKK